MTNTATKAQLTDRIVQLEATHNRITDTKEITMTKTTKTTATKTRSAKTNTAKTIDPVAQAMADLLAEDTKVQETATRKMVAKAERKLSDFGHSMYRKGKLTDSYMIDEALAHELRTLPEGLDKVNLVALAEDLGLKHARIVRHVKHLIEEKGVGIKFVFGEQDKAKHLFVGPAN